MSAPDFTSPEWLARTDRNTTYGQLKKGDRFHMGAYAEDSDAVYVTDSLNFALREGADPKQSESYAFMEYFYHVTRCAV